MSDLTIEELLIRIAKRLQDEAERINKDGLLSDKLIAITLRYVGIAIREEIASIISQNASEYSGVKNNSK